MIAVGGWRLLEDESSMPFIDGPNCTPAFWEFFINEDLSKRAQCNVFRAIGTHVPELFPNEQCFFFFLRLSTDT